MMFATVLSLAISTCTAMYLNHDGWQAHRFSWDFFSFIFWIELRIYWFCNNMCFFYALWAIEFLNGRSGPKYRDPIDQTFHLFGSLERTLFTIFQCSILSTKKNLPRNCEKSRMSWSHLWLFCQNPGITLDVFNFFLIFSSSQYLVFLF